MKTIAIIPARAGSQGVKNKNIRLVNGKPLICHTIIAARSSGVYSDVIVTTDSPKIAEIATDAGASVPFIRSDKLADNKALAVDVMVDSLKRLDVEYSDDSYFCMLQPTTPLRSAQDCVNVHEMMTSNLASSVISVTECSEHPYKMVRKSSSQLRLPFLDWPVENPPRQSLPQLFIYNGAFYAANINLFLNQKTFVTEKTKLYEMPKERSVNVDDEIDLILADALLKNLGS
jgi:CMP-N,N'-diacetyllegionaminic acid synthase